MKSLWFLCACTLYENDFVVVITSYLLFSCSLNWNWLKSWQVMHIAAAVEMNSKFIPNLKQLHAALDAKVQGLASQNIFLQLYMYTFWTRWICLNWSGLFDSYRNLTGFLFWKLWIFNFLTSWTNRIHILCYLLYSFASVLDAQLFVQVGNLPFIYLDRFAVFCCVTLLIFAGSSCMEYL